ncbi:CapA family protein [Sphingomicrobium flavum]|uniref:CapA family protein n=1 Tax=Sphingomicrobium flavum TaxID=1229164 RepID=UPI0021ADFC43|nr:CapA family protein [Sphingomicrobium flavum]
MKRLTRLALAIAAAASIAACGSNDHEFEQGSIVTFGGDTHFGENYVESAEVSDGERLSDADRYTGGFDHLRPLLSRADYSIVNLETPLSEQTRDRLRGKDYLHFTDSAKAIPALKAAGIDAVGLANNHSMDQGASGLENTLGALDGSGLDHFGMGRDLDEASAPLIKTIERPGGGSVTLAVFAQFEFRDNYLANWPFYATADQPGAAPLDVARFTRQVDALRQQHEDLFVVAFPHWGSNYAWASDEQDRLGRQLVDAGADMVIGHHSHGTQEIARYKDRWILFGIGNLLFNSRGRFADYDRAQPYGLVAELSFAKEGGPAVRLHPFLSDNLKTGFKPRPASEEEAAALMRTIRYRDKSTSFDAKLVRDRDGRSAIQLTPLSWTNWW